MFCCWSMLLHCAADFFLHHDDAHRHLFPLLQFRFSSPISYWDAARYGRIVSLVEIVITIAASIFLFRSPAIPHRARRFNCRESPLRARSTLGFAFLH